MSNIKLIKYDILKDTIHCFTTRTGGVSNGNQASLNMSFSRESSRENVCENYRRCSLALGVDYNKMTGVLQKHTGNVLVIDKALVGNCISKPCKPELQVGYDAMITNIPGVTLCTIHADCVPVLLYDSESSSIAAIHSGWRSTAKLICKNTVEEMNKQYAAKPVNIKAVIGPSIQIDKFESDFDVVDEFSKSFNMSFEEMCKESIAYPKGEKYHISVSGFVFKTLLAAGLQESNIIYDKTCTYENSNLFFSHRRDKGDTGAMSAMICLND